jgi:hypothetical protein
MNNTPSESKTQTEYENNTHILKKKKAIATSFKKKNIKDVIDLMNEEDDDVAEKYARYIR